MINQCVTCYIITTLTCDQQCDYTCDQHCDYTCDQHCDWLLSDVTTVTATLWLRAGGGAVAEPDTTTIATTYQAAAHTHTIPTYCTVQYNSIPAYLTQPISISLPPQYANKCSGGVGGHRFLPIQASSIQYTIQSIHSTTAMSGHELAPGPGARHLVIKRWKHNCTAFITFALHSPPM